MDPFHNVMTEIVGVRCRSITSCEALGSWVWGRTGCADRNAGKWCERVWYGRQPNSRKIGSSTKFLYLLAQNVLPRPNRRYSVPIQ